jgi:hypothetical protein
MNNLTVEEISIFMEDNRDNLKNYYKNIQENIDIFIEEITISDSNFVAERKIEYLENKIQKLETEIQWWDMLSRIYESWFRKVIRETLAEPMRKEQELLRREIDIYRKPKPINYDKSITDQDIERAKNVDCADIIEVKKRTGNRHLAICPFHDDHNPSLVCFPPGDGFHCFSCGANGDTINLAQKLYNLNFVEAVRFLIKY